MTDFKSSARKKLSALKKPIQWLFRVLQGGLIGAGAILPGISGGVLCAVFGIYQPMMALLAHPLRAFKKNFFLLLPVLFGWAIGFFLIAKVLNLLFSDAASSNPATWLFVGLIMGMMPQLYREAGKQGRTYKSWIALAVSTVTVLALLIFLQYGTRTTIDASIWNIKSIWWYMVCGVLWGISLVIPGLSSSSILLYLGLYQSMTEGISELSLIVIIPMAVGILLVILISARAINYMFDRHYSSAFHAILGFVIASTVAIILPASGNKGANGEIIGMTYTSDVNTILIWVACFAVGFAIAWLMDKAGQRILARQTAE